MPAEAPELTTDPRPARTRAAILSAVKTLVIDQSTDISINAIARAAGVSRSAFYSQFADLDELAVAMLVDAFRDIGLDDLGARARPDADRRDLAITSNRRLLAHLGERCAFYRASLGWRLSGRVHETVVDAYAEQVAATMAALGGAVPPGIDHADAARFVAGGAIALLTSWVRGEAPHGQEAMVRRLLAVMPDWLVGTD